MNKEEAKKKIYDIFEYIDKGIEKSNDEIFNGHPGLYFFHTREEYNKLLDEFLIEEKYDRYDIYYIVQRLIKYLLNKYDSHTKLLFKSDSCFPIKFKIENNKVYVINVTDNYRNVIGGQLLSINGIPIENIIKELEEIICYSTNEYLIEAIVNNITQLNILRSLPSIDNNTKCIEYLLLLKGKEKKITFSKDTKYDNYKEDIPDNYTYEVIDNIMVLHYNACKDEEQMNSFIKQIQLESIKNKIDYYIVDIRNNTGGNSNIIYPLLDFLKDKNVVTLVNENVFSSGRMAFVELKKIGSYSIGTNISTSLNAFGNVPGQLDIEDMGLKVKRSSTYWYYDDNLKCHGFKKGEFEEYFKNRKDLLEPLIVGPDEYVYMSVNDIINGRDPQLDRAIMHIYNKKSNKITKS